MGSITHVVNASDNTLAAEYSYDACLSRTEERGREGRMRNPTTWVNYTPGQEPDLTFAGRGFTGHEHLPWFKLINMNGRVYDPLTGQFLSPDNYVQMSGFTQSYNRFTYCLNNPFKYTDPTGEKTWFGKFFDWVGNHKEDLLFSSIDPTYLLARLNTEKHYSIKQAVYRSFTNVALLGIPYWIYNKLSNNPNYNIRLDNFLHGRPNINGTGDRYSQSVGNMDAAFGKGGTYSSGNTVYNYSGIQGLSVYSYYGWDIDPSRSGYSQSGGLEIYLSYTSDNGGQWAQFIHTDMPYTYPTSPYWDAQPGSIYYESQWTDKENNVFFYDTPQRNDDCYWYSNLFFYEQDMVVLQLGYGFTIENRKTRIPPIRVAYP